MRKIALSNIKRWSKINNYSAPYSFSTWCPHCYDKVTFTCSSPNIDTARACISLSAHCPSCSSHIGVWSFGADEEELSEVYIHPNTGEPHTPKNVESSISEELYRSYKSTIDSYNSGNYIATAVCCRRTLEGLFQNLLPEDKRVTNLAKMTSEIAKSVDLAEPIRNLADVLRQGGNLGAHFDMEKEPDKEMAFQMLTLLENLIDYLHVLPNDINNLENLLDHPKKRS